MARPHSTSHTSIILQNVFISTIYQLFITVFGQTLRKISPGQTSQVRATFSLTQTLASTVSWIRTNVLRFRRNVSNTPCIVFLADAEEVRVHPAGSISIQPSHLHSSPKSLHIQDTAPQSPQFWTEWQSQCFLLCRSSSPNIYGISRHSAFSSTIRTKVYYTQFLTNLSPSDAPVSLVIQVMSFLPWRRGGSV